MRTLQKRDTLDREAIIMQIIFSFIQPYISLSFSPDGKMTHLFPWPAKQGERRGTVLRQIKRMLFQKQGEVFPGSDDDSTLLALVNTLHSFRETQPGLHIASRIPEEQV